MNKKKRHHYIPRFYLRGFVDPHNKPYVWVYEKGNPNITKATVENIAVQKHYYSFIRPSGDIDSETFENALAKIEGKVAPAFEKIIHHEDLNNQEKGAFAVFLAFTVTRVPNYRKNVERSFGEIIKKILVVLASSPVAIKSMIEGVERDTGKKMAIPVEEWQKILLDGQYNIEVKPQFSLETITIAKELVPIFYGMSWAFLEATEDYKFVTSDNPLFYFHPTHHPKSFYGGGLANKNIEVTFPISRDLMFHGTWGKFEGYEKLTNEGVKEMNRRTVISALRFVFASEYSHNLNGLVQEYKHISPKIKVS